MPRKGPRRKKKRSNEPEVERIRTLPDRFEDIPISSWYPGHMLKAQREMKDKLKLVDVVLELVDARIPATTINPNFDEVLGDKPRLLVLNKAGLAEDERTQIWMERLQAAGRAVIAVDAVSGRGMGSIAPELKKVLESGGRRRFRLSNRVMIVGVPNVGKSTIINRLVRKKIAETGPRPGVTRSQQWVKWGKDFELLDTPGVLYPRISSKEDEMNLALTAGMKDLHVGVELVAKYLLYRLNQHGLLGKVPGLADADADEDEAIWLETVGKIRGFVLPDGVIDANKSAETLLRMFRAGDFGRFTLDDPSRLD